MMWDEEVYVICCSLTLTRLDGVTTTTLSISGVAVTVHNTFSDLYYNMFMSVCVCSNDSHTIRALSLQRTQNEYIKIFYKNIHYYWIYNCPRPSIQLVEGTPGLKTSTHYKLVGHLLVILTLLQIVPDFPLKMYSILVLLNWTLSSHILK